MAIDDPILALERQLVGAARRRSAPRRRAGGGVVAVAAAMLVALAVAAGALALLGGRTHPVRVQAVPTAHDQLYDVLGVLRNPRTEVDLAVLPGARPRTARASLVVSNRRSARLAAVTPWGASVYLVPFTAAGVDRVAILVHGAAWSAANAARITRGRALVYVRSAGHARPLRLIQVVPDGVPRVSLAFAPPDGRPGELIETVTVHGNVAAFQVLPRPTGHLQLIWQAADGQTLKRVALP